MLCRVSRKKTNSTFIFCLPLQAEHGGPSGGGAGGESAGAGSTAQADRPQYGQEAHSGL